MQAGVDERLLDWLRALLSVASLPELAALAAQGPESSADDATGALILADPAHELRQLAFGEAGRREAESAAVFVDSLPSVAPECASLHAPWSGEYRAADHGLLLPQSAGLRHLLLLPLERRGQLLGVYCLGGRQGPHALATAGGAWQAQVAAVLVATLERLFDRARLLRIGMTDPLTGWHSRRYLHARMCEELARCHRYGGVASCLVVDTDRLRRVNEQLGPSAGDRVLREVGARLEGLVRASDTIAHLGGDQFAVLLPGTSAEQAVPLAERIHATMRDAPVEIAPGIAETISVSIGIASAQPAVEERKAAADQWLAEAEAALYRAKRGGAGWAISPVAASSAAGKSARPPAP